MSTKSIFALFVIAGAFATGCIAETSECDPQADNAADQADTGCAVEPGMATPGLENQALSDEEQEYPPPDPRWP